MTQPHDDPWSDLRNGDLLSIQLGEDEPVRYGIVTDYRPHDGGGTLALIADPDNEMQDRPPLS